jgi:FixJ family two-component response regulator
LSKPILVSIVDDDEFVRDAVEALVRSLGYLTCSFGSAEEFLTSAFVNVTSCLLCDMRMPGMSGADLQAHLNGEGRRLPIIFITADPIDELRRRLIQAGAVDVLLKPFAKQDLHACLERALSSVACGSTG